MKDKPIPFQDRSAAVTLVRRVLHWLRKRKLYLFSGGKLSWGDDTWIGRAADIRSPSFCHIGDRVSIGKNFTVEANLIVKDDVLISSNVSIVGNDHKFSDPSCGIFYQGRLDEVDIRILGNNLIGYGAIIVGPVVIGRGCIVGAGAVVVNDLPANTVCVGIPARPIKERFTSSRNQYNSDGIQHDHTLREF